TYYESADDANGENNAIVNPEDYQFPGDPNDCLTIYARIKNSHLNTLDVDFEDCYDTTSFQVCLNLVEIGQLEDLYNCQIGDEEFTTFDLTQNDDIAIGGQGDPSEFDINYYENQDDANAGTTGTEIQNPGSYENTSNPQTIYVRMEDLDTGCFDVDSFEIGVFSS